MNQVLRQEIEIVDCSYKLRNEEAALLWVGFDEEVEKLTGIVSKEFNRILGEIDLSVKREDIKRKVKINNFEVNYTPQLKDFVVEIKDWSVDIDGKLHSDREGNYRYCAHDYLRPIISSGTQLNPKIAEFKKDFNVRYINYDCGCGSDHK